MLLFKEGLQIQDSFIAPITSHVRGTSCSRELSEQVSFTFISFFLPYPTSVLVHRLKGTRPCNLLGLAVLVLV